MADHPNRPEQITPELPSDKRLFDEQAVERALNNITGTSNRHGYRVGWEAALQALEPKIAEAVLAAVRIAVESTIKTMLADMLQNPPTQPPIYTFKEFLATTTEGIVHRVQGTTTAAPPPRGSVPDQVLAIIGEQPGLTGAGIVRYAQERGTPLHERSIRTALRRLRLAGKIVQAASRWYLPADLPKGVEPLQGDDLGDLEVLDDGKDG